MKHIAKVGCHLAVVAGAMVLGALQTSARGIADIFESAESSGDYLPGNPSYMAANVFIASYWLAGANFSTYAECFVQANLKVSYTPRRYTLDCSTSNTRERIPWSFKLYGCTGTDGSGQEVWTLLDERNRVEWPDGNWSNVKAQSVLTFEIANPQECVKLKFVITEICKSGGTDKPCISRLTFDDNLFKQSDLVLMALSSGVENPFTVTSTGEYEGTGHRNQLFDGDLTVNANNDAAENGRALFASGGNPSVTISFNDAAFGDRPVILKKYGFRMGTSGVSTSWDVAKRMPGEWTVYVSDAESPADDDWEVFDVRKKDGAYESVNNCLSADYEVNYPAVIRHVRFEFSKAMGSADYVQLGEIMLSGMSIPEPQDGGGVVISDMSSAEVQNDGSVVTSALIVQLGFSPYDLFAVCQTEDTAVTNWFARGTCFTGNYVMRIAGLRLGTDYTLRVGAKPADGAVAWGSSVTFRTPSDAGNGGLPSGYARVEYLESTDGGCQYVDCGFSLGNTVLGLDFDFIGYNAFVNGKTSWQGNRDADYGVYLVSQVKGGDPALLISSSTGGSGTFPDGLFFYNAIPHYGRLTRNERMRVILEGGRYMTVCGATTNTTTVTQSSITCPNVFVFASGYGPGTTPEQFAVMRFYSLKIYDDSHWPQRSLIHDFVPVRHLADDTCGLFDLVDGRWCQAGGKVPLLAGKQSEVLMLQSLRYFGRRLSANITRIGEKSVGVYAAWGADYGGADTEAWQHTARCGTFEAGMTAAKFVTPNFGKDTVYVRFYTDDGIWSETVYLPEQQHLRSGMIIVFR